MRFVSSSVIERQRSTIKTTLKVCLFGYHIKILIIQSFMNCPYTTILIIDSREQQLKTELYKINSTFFTEQLPVGDIIYARQYSCECGEDIHPKRNILFICERKTMSDLYSSILSGRYAEQRERLKSSGVKIAYILEGNLNVSLFNPGKNSSPKMTILGALENMILYHNIYILPTTSVEHTANSINNIRKKLETKEMVTGVDAASIVSLTPRKDKIMNNIYENQLLLIPGVSIKVAKTILETYPTIRSLIDAYDSKIIQKEKELLLAELHVGKKKLGKVLSIRIYEVYNKR